MRRREAYQRELLCGGKARQLQVGRLSGTLAPFFPSWPPPALAIRLLPIYH